MKDFNKHLVGKNINHNDKLQNFILKADPKFNMIILPWNYSFNGDFCMALRKDFILSKMVLEAEMRQIGAANKKVSLNTIQTKILKKAQNTNIKVMTLVGGTGSGKTVMSTEVVKIWMNQHNEKYKVCSIHRASEDIGILGSFDTRKYPLLEYLLAPLGWLKRIAL